MTSKTVMPSLSADGWTHGTQRVADYLFSHFFLSDYSQTYMFRGKVASLPWILQETQGDMADTLRLCNTTLSAYFSKYFNNVRVEVTDVTTTQDPSSAKINFLVSFTDIEGDEFVLGKLLEVTNSKISKIIEVSNG